MDGGVGASGGSESDGVFDDSGQYGFDGLLDGGDALGLSLPAAVGGAVVGDGEFNLTFGHGGDYNGMFGELKVGALLVGGVVWHFACKSVN